MRHQEAAEEEVVAAVAAVAEEVGFQAVAAVAAVEEVAEEVVCHCRCYPRSALQLSWSKISWISRGRGAAQIVWLQASGERNLPKPGSFHCSSNRPQPW